MFSEFWTYLSDWSTFDTWIVTSAALSAMACALPGCFLVLRRQSLLGDVLSHTVLLGIVLGFLTAHTLLDRGTIQDESYPAVQRIGIFIGAIVIGIVTALLADLVKKIGRTESSAALGVIYTTLFALGLLLVRLAADRVHIDPDCVLFGMEELSVLDTLGKTGIPKATVINAAMLAINGLLIVVFFKELRLSSFDPQLADTLGLHPRLINIALLIITSATLVAAFESVGNILVIAMLIVPPATALLLTDRLSRMLMISLALAGLSAVCGHVSAITFPPIVFSRWGWPEVDGARTAGMMASASGLFFFTALLLSPRHGIVSKLFHRVQLRIRFIAEDILGQLYRAQEADQHLERSTLSIESTPGWGRQYLISWSLMRLRQLGLLINRSGELRLTSTGKSVAESIVRSHRLWESYMSQHLQLPVEHLHATAEWVEHYLDPSMRRAIDSELENPVSDPQGKTIPAEPDE